MILMKCYMLVPFVQAGGKADIEGSDHNPTLDILKVGTFQALQEEKNTFTHVKEMLLLHLVQKCLQDDNE